jgi:rubrerythrin
VSGALRRREALSAAVAGAGALAFGGLLRPAGAAAQSEEVDALRDFLAEAVAREQIAVLAYARASEAEGADAKLRNTFLRFRDHEQAHANAFRSALDALGFDPPEPPDDPRDAGVFEDVEGISEELASELTALLQRIARPGAPKDFVLLLGELERDQLEFYVARAPALDSEDLAKTSAEIAASQGQHLVVLESFTGGDPGELLEALARLLTPAKA